MNQYIKNQLVKSLKKFKTLMLLITVIFLCVSILVFSSASSNGVTKGLIFSSEILIPSLFPFMVLSEFIVKSSLAKKLGKFIEPVTQLLFRLPGCAGPTIFLSLVGGYPAGAQGVKALTEQNQISQKQSRLMMRFCVGAGPAFVISTVGTRFLGSTQIGIILFISQIISAILIGFVSGRFQKIPAKKELAGSTKKRQGSVLDVSTALVESCYSSTVSMINLCSFVIIFSAFISIIDECGIIQFVSNLLVHLGVPQNISSTILPILLEVTGGCADGAKAGIPAEIMAYAINFTGFCVQFQIGATLRNFSFSKIEFTFYRFLHGLLAAIFTHVGLIFFPQVRSTISTVSSNLGYGFSSHTEGSISLILLCICFLASLSYSKKRI